MTGAAATGQVPLDALKVRLIQLYSREQAPSAAPYSIEVLAGHLREFVTDVQVDLAVLEEGDKDAFDSVLSEVCASSPGEVLGLSCPQGTHDLAVALLSELQRRGNLEACAPLVVLGNTLPTYRPEVYLERFPRVIVVRGFGEETLADILQAVRSTREAGWARVELEGRLSTLSNIALWRDGRLRQNRISWPTRHAIPAYVDPQRYFARVETSRGCHYDACTFCTRPPRERGEPRWVRHPLPSIAKTLSEIKALGIERFTFCDEDFIGEDFERVFAVVEMFESLGGLPPFSFSTRADNIVRPGAPASENARRRQLFTNLSQVGLSLVFVGLESFCNAQLKRLGKRARVADNIACVETLRSLGIEFEAGFIGFDPFMTVPDLEENIRNLEKYELWRVTSQTLGRMDVQEASPMKLWVERRGLLGKYDLNLMTYEYRFEDHRIQRISDLAQEFKAETDYAYRLVRNAQRMALFVDFPNDIMLAAKRLNFEALCEIAGAVLSGGSVSLVMSSLRHRRADIVRLMLNAAGAERVHPSMSDRLRAEIDRFLQPSSA